MNIKILLRDIKSHVSCIFKVPYFYGSKSYSQEGEDIIIERYFQNKNAGFYLDIGAYHPYKYSNTYKLYKKGWKGINIDAGKESISLFNMVRVRDRNILATVGGKSTTAYLYEFEDAVFNTIIKENKEAVINAKQSKLRNKYPVKVIGINEIIKRYVRTKKVDYLNIDAEGVSYEILKSINYRLFKPSLISVEKENMGMDIKDDKCVIFMKSKGYALLSSTPMTHVFKIVG